MDPVCQMRRGPGAWATGNTRLAPSGRVHLLSGHLVGADPCCQFCQCQSRRQPPDTDRLFWFRQSHTARPHAFRPSTGWQAGSPSTLHHPPPPPRIPTLRLDDGEPVSVCSGPGHWGVSEHWHSHWRHLQLQIASSPPSVPSNPRPSRPARQQKDVADNTTDHGECPRVTNRCDTTPRGVAVWCLWRRLPIDSFPRPEKEIPTFPLGRLGAESVSTACRLSTVHCPQPININCDSRASSFPPSAENRRLSFELR